MAANIDNGPRQKQKSNIRYFFPKDPDKSRAKFSFPRRSKDSIEEAPVAKEKLKKWRTGEASKGRARTKFHSEKIKAREEVLEKVAEKSARAELLCTEETGALEGERTYQITQNDIRASADEATQQKIFDLRLNQFGPYRLDYTRNGRHLLIGGAKGHVAAFDWQTKGLHCEINVMETVTDVKWLHQETMFAVAQRKNVFIYDNQGIELHCLKHLDSAVRLEFLPYHFLLVSSSAKGYLSYLDVSIGKEVSGICTKQGRLDIMTVNSQSAIVHLGHPNGTVSLWTPNMKEPAAKILCHASGLRDVAVDISGNYMATTSLDRRLKIFDLRTYKELSRFQYNKRYCPGVLDFSQKGILAVSRENVVELYKDMTNQAYKPEKPYLYHRCDKLVQDIMFCPYEDVLGIGHGWGFSSIVIPGAGEPNFDALEANPYQSKSQRKQTEVRMLLDKVQPETITLEGSVVQVQPETITLEGSVVQVDLKTAAQQQEERNKNKFLKPCKIDFTPRHKKKGGDKASKVMQRKKGVQEEHMRSAVRTIVRTKQEAGRQRQRNKSRPGLAEGVSALERLKKKSA
ncbi:WD repeat-containing protein 46-like [Plakobranchus ocellatus]|uniref:WD repeat-containing protein 46-like n=1 Tax=Plakobranchus ocellatus TaxID=259542 RepID=A0AAV4DY93_9GAST|nr:WD repeat-containing protein 46-like [Plakobranchus ocellatus]